MNVKRASQNPKATEFIEAMIDFIQELLDKDYAYISEGDVYFRVAKSKNYAKLANKNLADLLAGASGRTDEETNLKESPADFALWKSVKADEVSCKPLGEQDVRVGILNVLLCQLRYWVKRLIFMEGEQI